MKIKPLAWTVAGAFWALAAGPLAAQAMVMRDAATHDELAARLRASSSQDPLKMQRPSQGADPSTANRPESIVATSDFLSFVGKSTLVPKRAILHIPANFTDRVKLQPGSTIQSWAEFFAMNRAWLTTVEVTRAQAEGNAPLAEDVVKRLQKSPYVVVATYQRGPISVLPLKTPVQTVATQKP